MTSLELQLEAKEAEIPVVWDRQEVCPYGPLITPTANRRGDKRRRGICALTTNKTGVRKHKSRCTKLRTL